MAPDPCAVCGEEFPFSYTVHMLIHTQSEEGVIDHYVCRGCYESEIEPAFE